MPILLSEPACGLIKPIEIDYNLIEVEDQYLQANASSKKVDH